MNKEINIANKNRIKTFINKKLNKKQELLGSCLDCLQIQLNPI